MIENDLTITTILCFVLLLLATMGLILLLVVLLRHNRNQQEQSLNLVTSLLVNQTVENQSLRNQLRAADVASLHGLNSATVTPKDLSSNPEDTVPVFDDGIVYQQTQQDLKQAGYGLQEPPNDFAAAGWESIVVRDTDGGTPIRT